MNRRRYGVPPSGGYASPDRLEPERPGPNAGAKANELPKRLNPLHRLEINHGWTRMNTDSIQREDAKTQGHLPRSKQRWGLLHEPLGGLSVIRRPAIRALPARLFSVRAAV